MLLRSFRFKYEIPLFHYNSKTDLQKLQLQVHLEPYPSSILQKMAFAFASASTAQIGGLKRSAAVAQRASVRLNAKAGSWLPGAESPAWLDGSLPGLVTLTCILNIKLLYQYTL